MDEETKTMLLNDPTVEVKIRETEDGEELVMTAKDMYEKYADKVVFMKLCAYDNYGKKRSIWRPCKLGIYVEMKMP